MFPPLCTWHINKMVLTNTKKMFARNDDFQLFNKRWTDLMYATTEASFELMLATLRVEYADMTGLLNYLEDTWLRDYKNRFVRAWTNPLFHLGETTTQRVESAHSTLKQHLGTCIANFEALWSVFHGMLDIQHNRIKSSFEVSLNVVQHGYMDGLYRRLRGYISLKALKLIRNEVERGVNVGTDRSLCGCDLRTTCGLPCAHELNVHILAGSPIPLEDIHVYWKKLSMVPDASVNRTAYNLNDELQRVVSKFETFVDEDSRVRTIQQLREISCPSSTSCIAPQAKVKTRGRPSLDSFGNYVIGSKKMKKGKRGMKRKAEEDDTSTTRDPSGFEYVLTPAEAASARRKVKQVRNKVHRTRGASMGVSEIGFIHTIQPDWIQHVETTVNMVSDGNCGFRCVAAGLGFSDIDGWKRVRTAMINELQENQEFWKDLLGSYFDQIKEAVQFFEGKDVGSDKWMTLPDMGLLIATTFNVVLVNVSYGCCMTFLPLRNAPPPMKDRVVIGVTNVNDTHWVRVIFKPNAPVPPVFLVWKTFANVVKEQ
ncbi:hypothetical protein Sjap_015605 [Stephania japonica]|uniref:Protein FAR1-RELATED SEQUENCE n=1 Tax=Stephania japonica TaxID=461633 RepID=A0AAP0IKI6_9MAGN